MRKIYRSISLLIHEEKGMAKILVAFSIIMLIGFTALVVDVGALYAEKSNLQKSLDAAVLGGAQVLTVSEVAAEQVAIDLAWKNGFTVTEDEVDTGANFIEINKTVNKKLTFAKVLGFSNANVGATARAETVQTLFSGEGIIPVALERGAYEEGPSYTMHFEAGNPDNASVKGNFGFLAIEGPGGQDLREGIMNGATREINEEFEYTKTGLSWGNVKKGFNERIKKDKDAKKDHCKEFETADNTCSRIVTVPIVETFEGTNGKDMVKIVGFAAFWIEEVVEGQDKKVVGRFIPLIREGTFYEGENFGIFRIKLVK